MTTTRWTLSDGVSTHSFAINPDPNKGAGGAINFAKAIDEAVDTEDGPIIVQRQARNLTSDFTVVTVAEDEYQALWFWFDKNIELTLTDDLGQSWQIYLVGFDAQRIRSADVPWHHEIACRYLVLSVSDISTFSSRTFGSNTFGDP